MDDRIMKVNGIYWVTVYNEDKNRAPQPHKILQIVPFAAEYGYKTKREAQEALKKIS